MQRVTVGLALGALVVGLMIAATGRAAMLMVAFVFIALGLGIWAAMVWTDRGIKS